MEEPRSQKVLETHLVDKGWKMGLFAFAQGEKHKDLSSSDCKKVGIKNDAALIKEAVESTVFNNL